jgi:hypothetical protein
MVYPFSNMPGFGVSPLYTASQASSPSLTGDDFSLPSRQNSSTPQVADERSVAQEELRKIGRWRQMQSLPKDPQVSLSSIIGDDFSLPSSKNSPPPPTAHDRSLIQNEIDRISMLKQNRLAQHPAAQQWDTSRVAVVQKLEIQPSLDAQFLEAARFNDMARVKSILAKRFPEVEDWERIEDTEPSIRNKVKKFIDAEGRVNRKGALHLTTDITIARLLLGLGANPLKTDKLGLTPVICNHPELRAIISSPLPLQTHLKQMPQVSLSRIIGDDCSLPPHLAAQQYLAARQLDADIEMAAAPKLKPFSIQKQFFDAARFNDMARIKSILGEKFPEVKDWERTVDVDRRIKDRIKKFINTKELHSGKRPLHLTKNMDIARFLLGLGANPLHEDREGSTPEICKQPELHALISHPPIARTLKVKESLETQLFDNIKGNPKLDGISFHRAVKVDTIERIKDIIMKKFCREGVSWGKWDAETKARIEVFVNTPGPRGAFPIHYAHRKSAVRMLLELGASISPKNLDDRTPAEVSGWRTKPYPQFFMADALTRLESGEFSVSQVNERLTSYWKGLNDFYKKIFAKCLKLDAVCLGGRRIQLPKAVKDLLLANEEIAGVYGSTTIIIDDESDSDAGDSDENIAVDNEDVAVDEDFDVADSDEDVAVDGDFDESDLDGEIELFDDELLDVPPSTPLSKRSRLESIPTSSKRLRLESFPPSLPLDQSVPPSPITVPMGYS